MEHAHHHHTHEPSSMGMSFKIGISINLVFIAFEVFYGIISNSTALLADAGHNFSDVLALAFSWVAIWLSERKPTEKFTYGYRRSTILIAILNTFILLIAIGLVLWEAIDQFGKHREIISGNVITLATIGILVNGFTAWLFSRGKKHDLNIKSTFMHFVADAVVSLGVVIAGVIILFTHLQWIDSLVTLIIVLFIIYSTYHLLIDSINLALDAVPENIDINQIRNYLENLDAVTGIHDLHVWALSTSQSALTVHLTTNSPTDNGFIIEIQHHLHENYNIEHSTIQIEYGSENQCCRNNCN
jgi:cobalt-zinc-cadmium efflux system protein